jgi:hypothetical protein
MLSQRGVGGLDGLDLPDDSIAGRWYTIEAAVEGHERITLPLGREQGLFRALEELEVQRDGVRLYPMSIACIRESEGR